MVYNKEQMYMETCKSTNTRDPACKRSKGRVHFIYSIISTVVILFL